MKFLDQISLLLLLISFPVNCQNRCFRTRVHLAPGAVSPRDSLYACRGEEVTFECQVTHGASLEWASEPDILRSRPLSYSAINEPGETRSRGFYQSCLISITRRPPRSNFSSNLTFTPSSPVTVVCGDQVAFCSVEEEYALAITDVPVVMQGMLQHFFIASNENCPNVAVLFVIHEIPDVAPLNYELNVSSSDGCALEECPLLLRPGERVRSVTLMVGMKYNATLVVSNDCGSGSTTVQIHPQECKVGSPDPPTGTSGVIVGSVVGSVVGVIALLIIIAQTAVIVLIKRKDNSQGGSDDPGHNEVVEQNSQGGSDDPGHNEVVEQNSQGGSDDPGHNEVVEQNSQGGSDDPGHNEVVEQNSQGGSDDPGHNEVVEQTKS